MRNIERWSESSIERCRKLGISISLDIDEDGLTTICLRRVDDKFTNHLTKEKLNKHKRRAMILNLSRMIEEIIVKYG